ncbi:hypothetical protein MUN81_10270 [Hymenobacter sp. 5317J-9]|uniref:hypothetical protein n=1 Tax=Hymenobacter sp. 5317J-9 TaxID=2932250 RepID=UPI001FD67290|nr:hypothetical protein [Hymenobacter sp. 5317J-9]UOQ99863.1 hypothetical protein MUN81_10270 [Hymenobacter sp. 5317J-9]
MKTFKLYNYTSLAQAINTVAQELNNAATVSKKLASYIEGKAVNSISRSATLDAVKHDAAQHLPGFLDYLKAGVNLATSMPNCQESDQTLTAIEKVVTQLKDSHLKDGLRYVAYFQKQNKFAVTEEGKAALEAAVTRLESADEQTYEFVVALYTHLKTSYGLNSLRKLIPSQFLDTFTSELRDEVLVPQIKSVANAK